MNYFLILEENSQGIMNLYENTVKLIGPVPKQFECIYFIGMILLSLIIFSIFLFPFILARSGRR